MKTHRIITALSCLLFMATLNLITSISYSQPPGMPGSPEQAPVDGGLALLAAGGAAYAISKLRKNRQ